MVEFYEMMPYFCSFLLGNNFQLMRYNVPPGGKADETGKEVVADDIL